MSQSMAARRNSMNEKLKKVFQVLRATFDPHLDVGYLGANGVDISFVDLYREPRGDHFSPMSQSRLDSLEQRPRFNAWYSMEDPQWNYTDAHILLSEFSARLLEQHEETLFCGLQETKWQHRRSVYTASRLRESYSRDSSCSVRSSMQRMLHEYRNGDTSNPTRQYNWDLSGSFDARPLPHQMCMSMHAIPNVRGPLRSEVMIILALMGSRIKARRFQDQEVFPVSYSSTSTPG